MTYLLRLILILVLPAFALAAVVAGSVLGAKSAARLFAQMWREA